MGFSASVVSDTISNSVRVIKTTKQTYETPITYYEAVNKVVEKDGVSGILSWFLLFSANNLFRAIWTRAEDSYSHERSSGQFLALSQR
jgi:hypothetical protein